MNIERLLDRLGIKARRRGKEWEGLCPNPEHDDKRPGWRVRDEPGSRKHGYMNCYACGFGGSMVDLVMFIRGVDRRTARAWIEEGEGADDRPVAEGVRVEAPPVRRGFQLPDGVTIAPIEKWVTPAREFAAKRGIEAWQAERWGLGYAVDGSLGGRIVIPYRNRRERLGGYTARSFVGSPRRYKEPTLAEGADFGIMFGEQWWPSDPSRSTVYLAEGALNALAVERALTGAPVAATAGSSLRTAHAAKLALFARVVLLTDPDAAGDMLARTVQERLARHALMVRVRLASKRDANDYPEEELRRIIVDGTTAVVWAKGADVSGGSAGERSGR